MAVLIAFREGTLVGLVANTFRRRLYGYRLTDAWTGVVLPGRSVHTFFRGEIPLLVFVDGAGAVMNVVEARPRRLYRPNGAAVVIEVPPRLSPPRIGERVRAYALGDARFPDSVCYPDRKSGGHQPAAG